MKIKVINPNTTAEMTEEIRISAQAAARPDTEIICFNPEKGPATIESWYDDYVATFWLIEELLKSEKNDPPDAYVSACFGDPGIYAMRELTEKPVVGIAEAAIAFSSFIAVRFSIISVIPRIRLMLEEVVRRCGAEHRCAAIRTPNLTVMDYVTDPDRCQKILIEEAKKAVAEDYAEALLLGCAGMGTFVDAVRQAVPVPVLDAVASAVKVAESLVDLGLKTSKALTYMPPGKKEFKGMDDLYQP